MTANTEWFAHYLRASRDHFEYSQQAVATAGGPHRQLQAAIESGEEADVSANVMNMFDRAYDWPVGYTQALAEIGEYVSTNKLSDALLGDAHDEAAHLNYRNEEARPGIVLKTLPALYDKELERNTHHGFTYLGFDPDTGDPSFLEGPLLTNVGLDLLHPMILARHGATTIDVGLLTDGVERTIQWYSDGNMAEGAAQAPIPTYKVGVTEPAYAQAMMVDPLSEITTLSEAKRLAADLLRLRPSVPTTPVRAGFTLLAIATFGEDPLVTLTQLQRAGLDTSGREFGARFSAHWEKFYDPTEAGPALASPDRHVYDLLVGVLDGRDECMQITVHGDGGRPVYERRRTIKAWEMLDDDKLPSIVFYDGQKVPEFPIIQSRLWPTRALTFYAAKLPDGRHQQQPSAVHPQFGTFPYMRIGIASADDRDIVARHGQDKVGTPTNYFMGQAIYCDSGRARRVWIPRR